jgi:hypothetical protein
MAFSPASFWGLIPTISCSFSPENHTRRRFETAHFTPVCRTMSGFFDRGSQEAVCGGAEEVNPAAVSQKRIGLNR